MSRIENESRSSRPGGELNGGRAEPFRVLRLYSLEKKDPKKPGPARKTVQLVLEHLPPDMTPLLREHIEAQIRPQQVLEIDGSIVARGADVGSDDVEAAVELRGDLGEAYSFAHRMLWEVYERETAAIDRLTERSAEMFNRTQAMTGKLQKTIQDTLELQAALRAIFEGETLRKEAKATTGSAGGEEENTFSAKNIKDWVNGLGTLRDLLAELSKITKDIKSGQAAGAGDAASGA